MARQARGPAAGPAGPPGAAESLDPEFKLCESVTAPVIISPQLEHFRVPCSGPGRGRGRGGLATLTR